MERPVVHLYSDGACSPNPGKGGWGAVLLMPGRSEARRELSGAEPQTTNNRMELMGALEGLRALKKPCRVEVYTDSQYVRNAFERGWLTNWKRNGWKTREKEPVANRDLWEELDRLTGLHEVRWHWVKGHADNVENNRADALAVQARESLR
jgi:ribonuclease HI